MESANITDGIEITIQNDDAENSDSEASPTSSTSQPSQSEKTFQSMRCLEVSSSLVSSIGQGFSDSTLTGKAAGFVASDYADVKFVAVEFIPSGLSEPSVAVFGTNDDDISDIVLDGLIIAVDGFAKEFSDWGDAPGVGLSITDEGAEESKECLDLPGFKLADPPATPSAFDQAEFLQIAESQYGVIDESFEDGSTLTVMQLAYTICEGDVSVLRANLASRWDSSFQKFAIESLCPEKLN